VTPRTAHLRVEALLAEALRQPDPAGFVARAASAPELPVSLRRALAAASPDGLRLAALLVARLRFERLLRGSPPAETWFDRDPAAFSAAFRRYHAEVPPLSFGPAEEARSFARWLET
jgi:hypothetical protein